MGQDPLKISYEINKEYKPFIDEMLKLLSESFSISFIGYLRFFPDGRAMGFSSNLDWQAFFLQEVEGNRKSFNNALMIASNQKRPFFHLWPDLGTDNTLNALNSYNIWNGMSLYYCKKKYIDSWSFAGITENVGLKDLFLNHADIFEKYVIFVEKKYPFLFYEEIKAIFPFTLQLEKKSEEVYSNHEARIEKFISDSPVFRTKFDEKGNEVYLTRRESEILTLTSEGLSAKEIAQGLRIGHRTVEQHQENLRIKLDCTSKYELRKFV